MNQFNDLYYKIVNKPLKLVFNQYFYFSFFLKRNSDFSLTISDQAMKQSDKIHVKCRKLSINNWDIINDQEDNIIKQKLLLMFSLVETNFLSIDFDANGFVKLQTIDQLLKLDAGIIKKIIVNIEKFYNEKKDLQYRSNLTLQFKKLYNSDKGITLKYKQIGQYLNFCAFWQKLGLNYFQVQQLPHDVYTQFLMLMNIEMQVKNAELQKLNKKIHK